jgi:hypothetical protein
VSIRNAADVLLDDDRSCSGRGTLGAFSGIWNPRSGIHIRLRPPAAPSSFLTNPEASMPRFGLFHDMWTRSAVGAEW